MARSLDEGASCRSSVPEVLVRFTASRPQTQMPKPVVNDQLRQRSSQSTGQRTLVASPSAATTTTARAAAASASSAAPTVAAASAATAAVAARPVRLRTRFVHGQIAASEIGAVQRLHRLKRRFVIGHLDESKTPRLPGIAVGDDADLVDRAIGFEQSAHL